MRLWKAEAVESFDFSAFNHGDYYRAVEDKMFSENITKVLYPNDEHFHGRELRLEQQFFFVTCSLQDMMRVHKTLGRSLDQFHAHWAVQLNDTHPAIAIPEMMRLLIDENDMDWDTAWDITQKTFAYTNHTLLPEALETWSISLLGGLLPRHMQIIYAINHRFLQNVRARFPDDEARLSRMSIIGEQGERHVRMAHLAVVGSHSVNGVAALHSELLKERVLHDFAEMWPQRFQNVTNGVTPRRFVVASNPPLAKLLNRQVGEDWPCNLERLQILQEHADDTNFQQEWRDVKHSAKERLTKLIQQRVGVTVDPNSLFDIQAKRIHEYKRQHLNVLHILTLYLRLKQDPTLDIAPRTFIFGGKAAPGYIIAKLIIKLINSVAELVNHDPDVAGRLKVAFFPDYNVKNAQPVYPAADLSEQISMAGKEASGTGNMKFSLNGALTIGTLDGANVEIREEIGEDNFFLFGMTTDQTNELKACGYRPRGVYEHNEQLRDVLDFIRSGSLTHGDKGLFEPLIDNLLNDDPFLVLADYQAYIDCQQRVSALWLDQQAWTRASIINVARMSKFSSDRSIRDYCKLIWKVDPVRVEMEAIEPCRRRMIQVLG